MSTLFVSAKGTTDMTDAARKLIRVAAVASVVLLLGRPARAQATMFEAFAGLASGPSATVGASFWQIGAESLGFRESAAWMSGTDTLGAGGSGRAGVVFAAPVAGGPPIRPYLGLDAGIAKRQDADAYLFLRPAIGVVMRPGAGLNYLVEAGWSMNRRRPNDWSALVGVAISR